MRTTIRLNDSLMSKAKSFARKHQLSFTQLVEQSVHYFMAQSKKTKTHKKKIYLSTFKGNGVYPGIDLDSTQSLLEKMESYDTD